jgi:imidazolonepropionase-like amidohydrolase
VPKLPPAVSRAIVDEAHHRGLRVYAHAVALADVKDLLRAGIDGFAHLFRDREADEELMALLRERPTVFFMLTLWAPRLATYTDRPTWLDDPRLRETASRQVIEQFAATLTSRTAERARNARDEWSVLARNVAKLNAAGVRLVLGTDVGGNTGGGLFGWTEHVELENMVAAGLTPMQAIVAATRTAADVVGLPRLGTLEPGRSADFIVLDRNPVDDIRNTRAIARVYLRGVQVDRTGLRAAWSR